MTHYELLGVALDSDTETIHRAYRKLAKTCHPDACPNDPTAAERFKLLSEAHDALCDDATRRFYNADVFFRVDAGRDSLFAVNVRFYGFNGP